MPQETDRLKLPLPLGNENVTRESINGIFEKIDAGVATRADLDTLREVVSQMDIPDASLTQKGKVQLSSKTDGTSETVAATEKAVRDARVAAETNAKNASLPRAGGALTGRVIFNNWGGFSSSSDGLALYGSNCYLDGSIYRYENTHSNFGARGLVMRFAGGSNPQIYMFDTGLIATISGVAFTPTLKRVLNQTDYDTLFQSVSSGKASIAAAITGKGVAALGSDTHATLATKISQIYTGKKYASGTTTSASTSTGMVWEQSSNTPGFLVTVTGLSFRPKTIILRAPVNGIQMFTYTQAMNSTATANGTFYSHYRLYQFNSSTDYIRVYEYTGNNGSGVRVNDTSFALPVLYSNYAVEWEAYD
ncbi:hypothetical protein BS614_10095 [Paenibacillus xylanexedens]|uniref:tail fiber protein n=1 Tax=Paenibacillus xylanexedens TaxID=528191 RepID=UPI00093878F9|nr:phage tail protein [Paenibacillus xylanexedens]APO44320.1 hypothetical protein BS614_10095 [Paenibacillus xylanexedens]